MGQHFARMGATEARLLGRSCESLLGLVTGILADGRLNDSEITFLDTWLADHDELTDTWPGEAIMASVREVLADGVVTEEEREHLKGILSALIGGTLQETGAVSGGSTSLPLDDVSEIVIPGNSFCFTGQFHFGTRKACQKAVEKREGIVAKNIRKDLNYLVIGELASRDWAHTSHGRKIEKAMKYKEDGDAILIVSEENWISFL